MPRVSKILTTISFITAVVMGTCKPLAAEYFSGLSNYIPDAPSFQYADSRVWQYLRLGLNYLESPKPLSAPESVPPSYVHPDLKGFGAYGFSPAAYEDVQRAYPFFQQYAWQDVLNSQQLYDLANQAFADWLLSNLEDYIPQGAGQEEVFQVLHKAWNLGLTGFKTGREVIASRTKRAQDFTANPSYN